MIVRNSIHDRTIKTRKYSIEEIKLRILGEPFELLSTEYVNAHEKLEWKCFKCSKTWKANWHNISFGKGCRNCRDTKFVVEGTKNKHSFEYVKSFLSIKNICLLESVYVNAHTKMNLMCGRCGNTWKNDFHHLKGQNIGCPICSIRKGETHHRWKGSKYYKDYPVKKWTNELKESIRNRDNRKCQYPDCVYTDALNENKKLHVHHINGIKENCSPYNLVSLCNKHHMLIEANHPRDWEDYFYSITEQYEENT